MTFDRRSVLLGAGAALVARPTMAGAMPETGAAGDPAWLPLWPGMPPGGGGPVGPPEIGARGAVSNIAVPGLDVFAPARPNGLAILIAAGGGYKRIEKDKEARPAARWLAGRGITAFVLSYRLPREGWVDGPLAPLQDAQRALRLIRTRATAYGIDPERVGVLGFSAGGHLMGLAATRSAFASYPPRDAADAASARPATAALIYPIITLEPPDDHTATRVQLVGRHPTPEASAEWSVETHVRSRCPPVFLTQAEDDPISDVANSRIMARACERAGVPVETHSLATGGHGFGMGRPGTPSEQWPGWYAAWLTRAAPPT
jgi:acetyl esterase/lipase